MRPASVLLVSFLACARPAPPSPAPPPRADLEVLAPGGARSLLLAASERGYRLEDASGGQIGEVRVERERLIVTGRDGGRLSMVERSANGFSLSGSSGERGLLAEATAQGFDFRRAPGGARIGARDPAGLFVQGHRLSAVSNGAYTEVMRDGDAVLSVRGPVGADAAACLAWQELPLPERVALFVWLASEGPPG